MAGAIIDTGGAGLGALALAGAAGGVTGGVVDRAIEGEETTFGDVAGDVALGAAAGVVGGKLGEAVVNKVSEKFLASAANEALEAVGAGQGAVYGTKVHAAFQEMAESSPGAKMLDLKAEVSYKRGKVVQWGTKGSVRAGGFVELQPDPANV